MVRRGNCSCCDCSDLFDLLVSLPSPGIVITALTLAVVPILRGLDAFTGVKTCSAMSFLSSHSPASPSEKRLYPENVTWHYDLAFAQQRLTTAKMNRLSVLVDYQLGIADLKPKTLRDFERNAPVAPVMGGEEE